MDISVGGAFSLIAGANGIYDLVNKIKNEERRDSTLLRLLYLEIQQNLRFINALRLGTESEPKTNHPGYRPVGAGLCFAAHQAVFTGGLLDDGRLQERHRNGEPLYVLEFDRDGSGHLTERPLKISASQVLSRTCTAGYVINRLAELELDEEVQKESRYGVRLRTILQYEAALAKHLHAYPELKDIFINDVDADGAVV